MRGNEVEFLWKANKFWQIRSWKVSGEKLASQVLRNTHNRSTEDRSFVCPMSCLHGFDGAAHPRLPLFLPQGRARPKRSHWTPLPWVFWGCATRSSSTSEDGLLVLFWRPSVALVPAFPKASSLSSISYLYPSNKLFFSGSSNLCLFLLITSKALYDHRVWLKINVVCRASQ